MFKRFFNDTRKYFKYSIVSARSKLKTEVANSYLNWFWWILEPTCFMLIYTFIFGYVFHSSEPYFPIFIFIGLSMWEFFNRTINHSVKLIKANKPVVSKVYIPKYILIFERIWVNGFKMLISFGIVILMMICFKVTFSWKILYSIPILATLITFVFGCSTFLVHYGVFVEDLSNVTNIFLRLLFYLTGIFYHVSTRVPAPYGQLLTRYNPMAFLLESMRESVLYGHIPHRKLLVFWFIISLLLSAAGIRLIYRNENSYVKVI